MLYRQLGKNGPEIPVIGLGAWPIGGGMGVLEEADAIATVRSAIDRGIALLDTAQAYRTSENTLGKALKEGYRERCFLATKVSRQYAPSDIRTAIENSLRSLDVDHVDLYQVHSWNSDYPIEATMETMAKVQEEGKTRFIGVSNFSAEQMTRAYKIAPFHSNQPRYNLFDRSIENEDLPHCGKVEIGVLAHSPLGKGLLTGKYRPGHPFAEDDERSRFPRFQGQLFDTYISLADRLGQIAQEKGISMVQLAIAWILRRPEITCVLVGAKSSDQIDDHLAAVEVTFSDSELARIDRILQEIPPE